MTITAIIHLPNVEPEDENHARQVARAALAGKGVPMKENELWWVELT